MEAVRILEEGFDDIHTFVERAKTCVTAKLGDNVLRPTAGEDHRNAAEAGGFHRSDAEVLHLLGELELVHSHSGGVNEDG